MRSIMRSPLFSLFLACLSMVISPPETSRATGQPGETGAQPIPPSGAPPLLLEPVSSEDSIAVAERVSQYYRARVPMPTATTFFQNDNGGLTMADANYLRDALVSHLIPDFGPIVGYKAGLTSAPVQQQFGVDHPLRGVLLADMLLESGATVPGNFGTRPLLEADLMVRVGSTAINDASTREEAIAALDAVIPFIELPDLLLETDAEPTAADLIAINVGARLGVMGDRISFAPRQDGRSWVDALADIPVTITNSSGEILAEGNSQALLGHPLDVVLWLVDDLQQSGQWLHPGDLLSLGSITAPMPLEPETIRVQYEGLNATAIEEVVVTIEPTP